MKKLGCVAFAAVLGLMVVGCASSPEKKCSKGQSRFIGGIEACYDRS